MLSVLPPTYLPDFEVMACVMHARQVVLADTYQYSRQSLQNRARLRTPDGWQWVTVPLQHHQFGASIRDTRIQPTRKPWPGKHQRSLRFNYESTPYFDHYGPSLIEVLEATWTHLGALTCCMTEVMASWFGWDKRLVRASALPGQPSTLSSILAVVEERAEVLTVPERARVEVKAAESVHVLKVEPRPYHQNFEGFVPNLSFVDVVFNFGPDAPRVLRERCTGPKVYRSE